MPVLYIYFSCRTIAIIYYRNFVRMVYRLSDYIIIDEGEKNEDENYFISIYGAFFFEPWRSCATPDEYLTRSELFRVLQNCDRMLHEIEP
jgi:hypothetical protein